MSIVTHICNAAGNCVGKQVIAIELDKAVIA